MAPVLSIISISAYNGFKNGIHRSLSDSGSVDLIWDCHSGGSDDRSLEMAKKAAMQAELEYDHLFKKLKDALGDGEWAASNPSPCTLSYPALLSDLALKILKKNVNLSKN